MRHRTLSLIICIATVLTVAAQSPIVHPWKGKRVAYFGDSITDPRNKASRMKYWSYLEQWLGITPYVYGVSGRTWADIPRQADKCHEEHGDSIDAIIIFIGTNDFNQSIPPGEWYEVSTDSVLYARGATKQLVERKKRTLLMDDNTYRGRINIALDHVKRLYPTKQVVLLTPIHRAGFYPNDKNWQPTEEWANGCGEFVTTYVQASREAADVWAVPVIDWASASGLYPLLNEHAQYFASPETDRLHPNDEGHRRLAQTLMYQLLALPCTF